MWFLYSKPRLLKQHRREFLQVWPGPFPNFWAGPGERLRQRCQLCLKLASYPVSSTKKRYGEGAWKIWSCAPWHSARGFVCGFDNQIIAHVVWLKILPTVPSHCIVAAGALDVAGSLQVGCLWAILYIGYNMYSFYRDFRSAQAAF